MLAEENGNSKDVSDSTIMLSQLLTNASTQSFHELYALGPDGAAMSPRKTHKCCVYIASKSNYCVRLNSIQAFSDINRDVRFTINLCSFAYFYSRCVCMSVYELVSFLYDLGHR